MGSTPLFVDLLGWLDRRDRRADFVDSFNNIIVRRRTAIANAFRTQRMITAGRSIPIDARAIRILVFVLGHSISPCSATD